MQNNTFFGHYQPCNIIVVDQTASTNDYLKELLSNFKPQINFTAIMARQQTHGRGQRGTSWHSSYGKNLTFSMLYAPSNTLLKNNFDLTIISSLSVYQALKKHCKGDIKIKWPNDILINSKKISGILIENRIAGQKVNQSIIGIGVNVNEEEFPSEIASKTTSLKLENPDINLTFLDIIKEIQLQFGYYIQLLDNGSIDELYKDYNAHLFQKEEIADYIIEGQLVQGKIQEVQRDGLLPIKTAEGVKKYDLKDITYQI